jgi:predicted DNA-binding transcriptional regulator AlpA
MQSQLASAAVSPQKYRSITNEAGDLLNSRVLRHMLGDISDMTLYRWTRRGFPAPDVVHQGRKFWHRWTIDRWIADRKSDQERTAKPGGGRRPPAATTLGASA